MRPATHIRWLLIEAKGHKVLKLLLVFAVIIIKRGGWVLWDEKKDSHGMQVGIGWLALGQLNGSNTQRPDVGLRWC